MKVTNTETAEPTVDELNAIQAEWMALDSNAPEPEKRRVFKLMDRYPKNYISGHDGRGIVIIAGGPLCQPMEFSLCVQECAKYGGRTDIAWNGKLGQWYAIENSSPFLCRDTFMRSQG